MKKTWKEIVDAAIEAGFEPYASTNLSGQSKRDESISVGEYPAGEAVAELLKKLGIEIVDEQSVNESGGA